MILDMRQPTFVRPLMDDERKGLEAGLRSSDAFVLRRCQILLASARGEWAPRIARNLGCSAQTVRNAISAFNSLGLECLKEESSRPHTIHAAFQGDRLDRLRALLHTSPRVFDKPTSLWTLELAAEVSFEQGLSAERVTGETIRATLARLEVRWQRAKHWITSPDPEYQRKKVTATG
jgi:transposase